MNRKTPSNFPIRSFIIFLVLIYLFVVIFGLCSLKLTAYCRQIQRHIILYIYSVLVCILHYKPQCTLRMRILLRNHLFRKIIKRFLFQFGLLAYVCNSLVSLSIVNTSFLSINSLLRIRFDSNEYIT